MSEPASTPGEPPDPDAARAALVRLVRDEGRRVLATLVRTTGSLQLAEDAVQDATLRALETWPQTGVPAEPRAWLTLAARRRAIDLVRRESARNGKETDAVALSGPPPDQDDEQVLRDDLLRLVFTCCHPSLTVETQIALALRTLCGLSTAEVGHALLVPEPTMLKRLTRAKQKIARAAIPYRVPGDHELPERLGGVAATVYLLFNQGYAATGADVERGDSLVDEAVRLGRLLAELMPDEPTALGLLALMLLQDSRRAARRDTEGQLVLLSDQDRGRWRHDLVEAGTVLVGDGLRRSADRPDSYVVQAAVAACHALAPCYGDTDWTAILSWYDVLLTVHDTPVVRLNRAVAVAELHGPAAGLAEIDALSGLAEYPLCQAARGELLARLDRVDEARAAYAIALDLPQPPGRREQLQRRIAALTR